MTMNMPNWLTIGPPSAWADTFRPSLGDVTGYLVSRITFLSCTRSIPGLIFRIALTRFV